MERISWKNKEPPLLLAVSPTPGMLGKYDARERRLPQFKCTNKIWRSVNQRHHLVQVLDRPPIFELIFRGLTPAPLIRFARTCRLARTAVSFFFQRAFNVNKHLRRFISDPIGFRSLQARTGTLISGSNALQFMDRVFYPTSDLDIYTHPGHTKEVFMWLIEREGYTFLPSEQQLEQLPEGAHDFSSLNWTSWSPWTIGQPRTDVNWEDMHVQDYRMDGIHDVYQFEKPCPSGGDPLRAQIIAAAHTPLQCIMGFHSSKFFFLPFLLIFLSELITMMCVSQLAS